MFIFKERKIKIENEIDNASEEVKYFIKDIKNFIEELEEEGYTFNQAAKIIELAIKDIHNDVLWRKLKELNKIECISDALESMVNK